jgi:integrase
MKPADVEPTQRVFWWSWPTYDILIADLKRAGIERKDGLGRVVHFHSFRKTMQSLGVRYGVNQRAAQEILGHSDANLTAQSYTDVASLQLHDEIAKLP